MYLKICISRIRNELSNQYIKSRYFILEESNSLMKSWIRQSNLVYHCALTHMSSLINSPTAQRLERQAVEKLSTVEHNSYVQMKYDFVTLLHAIHARNKPHTTVLFPQSLDEIIEADNEVRIIDLLQIALILHNSAFI